jgi:hypothetical protein
MTAGVGHPGMPEPRVQRVQVHPLPFAFSTLWVQCGADYRCNGCTKLLQQTELNIARGSVLGCSTPQSSGIRQNCFPFGER